MPRTAQNGCDGEGLPRRHQEYQSGARQTVRAVQYVYDGWNLVEEIDVTDTQAPMLLAQYTWGLDLSRSMQGAGGIGGLLAAVDTAGTATTDDDREYWYVYDANGNVGQLLRHDPDTSTATLAAAYEYDPYGNTLRADDVDGSGIADVNRFRFSTKYLHDELAAADQPGAVGTTGLYYYGYRYYSPGLGRWINRDPAEESGGANLYVFVDNDCLNLVDHLGLMPSGCSGPTCNLCPEGWDLVVGNAPAPETTAWELYASYTTMGNIVGTITRQYYWQKTTYWEKIPGFTVRAFCGEPLVGSVGGQFTKSKTVSISGSVKVNLFEAVQATIGLSESKGGTKGVSFNVSFNEAAEKCVEKVGFAIALKVDVRQKSVILGLNEGGTISTLGTGWHESNQVARVICQRKCSP